MVARRLLSDCSLDSDGKRGGPSGLGSGSSSTTLEVFEEPMLVGRRPELDGGRDVEEHPVREEPVELLGARAGQLADGAVEGGELLADDRPDVRVGARGVGLELDEEL